MTKNLTPEQEELLKNWEEKFSKLKLYCDTLPWKEADYNETRRKEFVKSLLQTQRREAIRECITEVKILRAPMTMSDNYIKGYESGLKYAKDNLKLLLKHND